MLAVADLCAVRDDRVLFEKLHFTLQAGDIMQVVGANGAGKTTLLNGLMGLTVFESGRICWQHEDIEHHPTAFKQQVAFVGHLLGLKPLLSAIENLQFLATLHQKNITLTTINAALKKVGLYGYEDVPIAKLSAGQKRRVALARLFIQQARLWVLDEPFTAIDLAGVKALEQWLIEHAQQGGMVLLTTHHVFEPEFPLKRLDLAQYRVQEDTV